ncbi:ABC transporter permease [Plantactinospora sp. GCM10030261]|uniref:ABC transporter permease n=1 Tax=Plantactinospora sp. GCM10030261 TaxID=3273420 RepID=UPI00361C7542
MTTTSTKPRSDRAAGSESSALVLGFHRGVIELKGFFREWDNVAFTFALPIVLLLLLGSLFDGVYEGSTVTSAQYMVPSMIAAGVVSATFVNLGINIAADREDGTLKRLRGTPMPKSAYFIGKVIMVLVIGFAEVAIILGLGVALFDLALPTDPAKWLTLAWVFLLGVVACSFLGIAASSLARSERSAGAVMHLPYIVLAFISGVFFTPIGALPDTLARFGAFFPLKWMGQGFRSVFLPDTILPQEIVTTSWEHGRTALVLGAWCVGGLILCLTVFRWRGRRER